MTVESTHLPVYSVKQTVRGAFLIFSSKRSFLLRKRMMEVSVNHLLLQIESNNFSDSCIRFCNSKLYGVKQDQTVCAVREVPPAPRKRTAQTTPPKPFHLFSRHCNSKTRKSIPDFLKLSLRFAVNELQ